MDLEDQTVFIVTGTANSGEATARRVAEAGGTVGFTYNASGELAEALLDELPGDDHEAWQCDVTDPDDTTRVVDDAFETLDGIDAIVYTVGVISRESIANFDEQVWQNHLDANVTGAFHVVRAAAPHLEAQGHGAIAAVSAAEGILRNSNLAAYDASKQGLEALIKEAARELGPAGVRANVVAPGFIRDVESLSEDAKQDLLDQLPYERITRPEDVAEAALFLCSDGAPTVTGAVLPVDGGLSL